MDKQLGRIPKCTPEMTRDISGNIALGLSNADVCAMAGINDSTFYRWMAVGKEEIGKMEADASYQPTENIAAIVEFCREVQKAIPLRKKRLISSIHKAAPIDWKAAAWLLERLHPEEFQIRVKQDITVDWRKELRNEGVDPALIERQVIEVIEASFRTIADGNSDGEIEDRRGASSE